MHEAELYSSLDLTHVKCLACPRYCRLSIGQIGFCGIRKNVGGKLFLTVYGKAVAVHMDPIEKKPFSHYMPGSKVLSIGTTGCNWSCQYCQNSDISQRKTSEGSNAMPEWLIDIALRDKADGIAYTYNEPTIFIEYAHDVGVLAKSKGLFNVFVSNGYATQDSVKMMLEFLDAITVDFKGNAERRFLQKYAYVSDPEPIFQTLLALKKGGVHIEITDLIVPEVGDNIEEARKLCKWILDNMGEDTPIHFLRFHPDFNMLSFPSTPISTLEKHYAIAKETGLKYAYLGNVPGHPLESTYCSSCKKVVIKRYGFDVLEYNLSEDNRCKFCGNPIPITGTMKREAASKNRFYSIRP